MNYNQFILSMQQHIAQFVFAALPHKLLIIRYYPAADLFK